MKISEKIKKIRNELGINQSEFTKKLNVTQSTVSKYERGEREPEFDFINALVRNFNVSPNWLFLDIEPMFLDFEHNFLSEANTSALQELNLLMSQPELNDVLAQIINEKILKKFDEEQNVLLQILQTLHLDAPRRARPFLFLYYIFRYINENKAKQIESYKDYFISVVEKYKIRTFANQAVFTEKIKQDIKIIIELKLTEEECKALVGKANHTITKLEEKMPLTMLKHHRKMNLSSLFS